MPDGSFLVDDSRNNVIDRVSNGTLRVVAGVAGPDGSGGHSGLATATHLSQPAGVAALPDGSFLIADSLNHVVRRVSPNGYITTVAGNGSDAETPHATPWARSTSLGIVISVATIPRGGYLIESVPLGGYGNATVYQVAHGGRITELAGSRNAVLAGDGGPATAASIPAPSLSGQVAALVQGGILITTDSAVRYVVSDHGPAWLAAAIRPTQSVATRTTYTARLVLTEPAQITERLYRDPSSAPDATSHTTAPQGTSLTTMRLGRHLTPAIYAIDLTARHGAQATRAEQYAYLGGRLTTESVKALENNYAITGSFDPNAITWAGPCRQFSSTRVDCALNSGYGRIGQPGQCVDIDAWLLGPQGLLQTRTYGCRGGNAVFDRNPSWSPPVLRPLSTFWGPGPPTTTGYPTAVTGAR